MKFTSKVNKHDVSNIVIPHAYRNEEPHTLTYCDEENPHTIQWLGTSHRPTGDSMVRNFTQAYRGFNG